MGVGSRGGKIELIQLTMHHKAKYWGKILDELEKRVTTKAELSREEMKTWVADIVLCLSVLKVPSEIITGLLEMFRPLEDDRIDKHASPYSYWQNSARMKDRVDGFLYVSVAFKTARAQVQNIEENERLVPQSLIDLLRTDGQYSAIETALESTEKSYSSGDIQNLLAASQSLLQALVNLDSTLLAKDKDGIKKQLNCLMSDETLLQNFGCDRELIETLHGFRYLRNRLSQHQKNTGMWTLPISIGYGFAALVLYLLHLTIARGVLIKV